MLGQQTGLDANRKIKVLLQGMELRRAHVFQASARQRIGEQSFLFDGRVAKLTHAVRFSIHLAQSPIDFLQQTVHLDVRQRSTGIFQEVAARQKVRPQKFIDYICRAMRHNRS